MNSISFNRTKAKGFSLIELLLVLGVLAILLVAAFVVYPQVRDRNQANAEVANLTSIKASINNLYASRGGNYAGLTTTVANQARAFPQSMNGGTYTGATITSAWGGTVAVAEGAAVAAAGGLPAIPAGRSFTVTYTAVPDGVCLGLVSGAATNFARVAVGSTQVVTGPVAGGGGGAATPGGFNPATAAAACTGNPTVVFTSN